MLCLKTNVGTKIYLVKKMHKGVWYKHMYTKKCNNCSSMVKNRLKPSGSKILFTELINVSTSIRIHITV
jgi:hypothetical protein